MKIFKSKEHRKLLADNPEAEIENSFSHKMKYRSDLSSN